MDVDEVTELLVEEAVRSAANKGCASVEAPQPDDPAERARWEDAGSPNLVRAWDARWRRREPAAAGPADRDALPLEGAGASQRIGEPVSKNVAVFVDVANIFYAAKAAGVDIDYVTLLKAASAGRDLVRAYAYTGLDPDNENQRNFHDFLRRHGYKVVSKDIRKYGDGKVKANLDIELVVDMMKTARNLDIAIVVSGDGDFAPAIRAVQEMGVRVEVISFRGNTSSDLIEVADIFTDITQIAKVEKGSSRSGRRVADDEEDLSMTEVPDKRPRAPARSRRGRGRGRPAEAEPAAATRESQPPRRGAVAVARVAAVAAEGTPRRRCPARSCRGSGRRPPPSRRRGRGRGRAR